MNRCGCEKMNGPSPLQALRKSVVISLMGGRFPTPVPVDMVDDCEYGEVRQTIDRTFDVPLRGMCIEVVDW